MGNRRSKRRAKSPQNQKTQKEKQPSQEPKIPRPKAKDDRVSKFKKPFPRGNPKAENKSLSIQNRVAQSSQSLRRRAAAASAPQEKTTTTTEKKPHQRWPRQDPPITDIREVPKDWNWHPNELDLETDDLEGNIARARERIEDGIIPQIFERRLAEYEKKKKVRDDMIASEPAGLDMAVIIRLQHLKQMKKLLEKNGDENEQLPNVNALLKAYRERTLDWSHEAKVTYWYKGKQLSEPRDFVLDDLVEFNRKYDKGTGFWVEGFSGPEPKRLMQHVVIQPLYTPNLWPTHLVYFEVRIPGAVGHCRLEFLEDSGANTMSLWNSDLQNLSDTSGFPGMTPLNLGESTLFTASGTIVNKSVLVEARIATGDLVSKWYLIEAVMREEPVGENTRGWRLSGSWWREVVFTASLPDSQRTILASDNYWEFVSMVPNVDPNDVIPVSPPKRGENAVDAFEGNIFDVYLNPDILPPFP